MEWRPLRNHLLSSAVGDTSAITDTPLRYGAVRAKSNYGTYFGDGNIDSKVIKLR